MSWWRHSRPQKGLMISKSASFSSELDIHPEYGHIVLRRHRGILLGRYWVHVLAVLATAAITTLNILEIFLTDDQDTRVVTKLNAFQFVARLHEAMLLGSLILVLMDAVRTRLLTPDGVALGHFLSPFTFTNFDFISSGQFWRCIQFKSGSTLVSILLLFAIPFANIAGPLSAVTIVPRLGWSRPGIAGVFPQFFNASTHTLWPEVFNSTVLPSACQDDQALSPPCPGVGVKSIGDRMDYSISPGALCTTDGVDSSCNVSVSDSLAASAIPRTLSVEFSLDSMKAYATSPSAETFETIAQRFEAGISFFTSMPGLAFIDADKTQLVEAQFSNATGYLKPIVAVSCQELDYDGISQLLSEVQLDLNWTSPSATWLKDVGAQGRNDFLFSYKLDDPQFDLQETCTEQSCFVAVSCDVDARWLPHKLWYNTAQSGSLFQSYPQPRRAFYEGADDSRPIVLRRDWLDLTTTDPTTRNASTLSTTITKLINDWKVPHTRKPESVVNSIQESIGPTNRSVAVAIILAATLTESLAQSSGNVGNSLYNGNCSDTKPGFEFSAAICAQNPTHWVTVGHLDAAVDSSYSMVRFTVRRLGYGWFMLDSILIKIALAVLVVHALATTIYLLCILVRRKTITTRWPSAAELVILAIDSFRAPELIGSTICVEDKDVWRKRVLLREVDYGDRLSLIVGDAKLYPERVGDVPMVSKKYR